MAPVSAPSVVDVRRLRTRLGGTLIHDDVSLDVRRGEIFALAGPSGCGKSTLLRILLMLVRPLAGEVRVFGEDVMRADAAAADRLRRRIGVLFQGGALFSGLTVLENVSLPLREHTRLAPALIREIAAFKMRLAGLSMDAANKTPAELSGGMRKRAGLARALALDPEVVFLDEPTAGLDPENAAAFDELVATLRDSLQLTVFMVTHDLDSLWAVAGRVAVLSGGHLVGLGSMTELSHSNEPALAQYVSGARGRAAQAAWNRA